MLKSSSNSQTQPDKIQGNLALLNENDSMCYNYYTWACGLSCMCSGNLYWVSIYCKVLGLTSNVDDEQESWEAGNKCTIDEQGVGLQGAKSVRKIVPYVLKWISLREWNQKGREWAPGEQTYETQTHVPENRWEGLTNFQWFHIKQSLRLWTSKHV